MNPLPIRLSVCYIKNKFGALKTKFDGFSFDSKAEFERYKELKILKKSGIIKNFIVHPKWELQPKYNKDSKIIRSIYYIADFEIEYQNGIKEIEDVKGKKTKDFNIKKKIFEYKYPNKKIKLIDAKQYYK